MFVLCTKVHGTVDGMIGLIGCTNRAGCTADMAEHYMKSR